MNTLDFQLHSILLQLQHIAKSVPNNSIQNDIDSAIQSLQEKRLRVAVLGDFKRGKSSLINALLGMNILPVDIEPTTATVNRITFGIQPAAVIHYKSGDSKKIDIKCLADYVTKLTDQSAKIAETIREAEIQYPLVLCANNVEIIDTPGLNDTESMTAVVEDILQDIDAAIFAVKASMPYSQTECEWVAKMLALPNLQHVVFAMTCADLLSKRDVQKMVGFLRDRISNNTLQMVSERYPDDFELQKKAKRILSPENLQLYPVSAMNALEAFDTGDNELLEQSNLPMLKMELVTVLNTQQQKVELYRVGQLMKRFLPWIREDAGFKREILNKQNLVVQLTKEDERQQRYFSKRAEMHTSICRDLEGEFKGICQTWNSDELASRITKCYIDHLSKVTVNSSSVILKALEEAKKMVRNGIVYFFGQKIKKEVNKSVLMRVETYLQWRREFLFPNGCSAEGIRRVFPEEEQIRDAVVDCLSIYRESEVPEIQIHLPRRLEGKNIIELIRIQVKSFSDAYLSQWNQVFPEYTQNAVYAIVRTEQTDVQKKCSKHIEGRIQALKLEIEYCQQKLRDAVHAYHDIERQYAEIQNLTTD